MTCLLLIEDVVMRPVVYSKDVTLCVEDFLLLPQIDRAVVKWGVLLFNLSKLATYLL